MLGSGYAVHRRTWDRLGGFTNLAAEWGFLELSLTLACWATDTPILVDSGVEVFHRYRQASERKFRIAGNADWCNQACACYAWLPETWPRMRPWFAGVLGADGVRACEQAASELRPLCQARRTVPERESLRRLTEPTERNLPAFELPLFSVRGGG